MNKDIVLKLFNLVNVEINRDIIVYDDNFYKDFLSVPSLALGEYYMNGKIDIPNISSTLGKLMILKENYMRFVIMKTLGIRVIFLFRMFLNSWFKSFFSKLINYQSLIRSKEVAEVHYDLPRELYEMMLDDKMQYSCAYFNNLNVDLNIAQRNKINLIINKLKIEDGMTIIDIGCGFGTLCHTIASRYPNCKVIGVNISKSQLEWISDRVPQLDNLTFIEVDYRNLDIKCDRVVSVGMFEHVGKKNYDCYLKKINSILNDKGLALIHTIANKVSREGSDEWINKYIFPGGRLPSPQEILDASLETDLLIEDVHNFGLDYAKTLFYWRQRFLDSYDNLRMLDPLFFDDVFRRRWIYYLGCCESIFYYKNTILLQMVFTKKWTKCYSGAR